MSGFSKVENEWVVFIEEKTGQKFEKVPVAYVRNDDVTPIKCPKVKEVAKKEKLDRVVVAVPLSLKLLLQEWYRHSHNEVAIIWKPKVVDRKDRVLWYIEEWDVPDKQRPSPAYVEIVLDTKLWEGGAHLHPPGVTNFSATDENSILQQYEYNLLFLAPDGEVIKIAKKATLPCGTTVVIVTSPIEEIVVVRDSIDRELKEFEEKWKKLKETAVTSAASWVSEGIKDIKKERMLPSKILKRISEKKKEDSEDSFRAYI